jgi:hypothetical protein
MMRPCAVYGRDLWTYHARFSPQTSWTTSPALGSSWPSHKRRCGAGISSSTRCNGGSTKAIRAWRRAVNSSCGLGNASLQDASSHQRLFRGRKFQTESLPAMP